MLAVARRRLGSQASLVHASAESIPFADATFDHLTFTYLLRYVDDPAATLAELARVVRPGGTVASLEFGVPRGPARPLWDLYVGIGLPLAGRLLRNGWDEVGGFLGRLDPGVLAALPARAPARALAAAGLRRGRSAPPEPRRRGRHLGHEGLRPSWYALERGGWRDYVTLLHPPYTAWHLSYVVIGGCLAPAIAWGRLGAAVAAFALAVGVGAHALDELRGRPLAHDDPGRRPRRAGDSLDRRRLCDRTRRGGRRFRPWLALLVALGLFLVVAYNLELAGGRFHSDLWFGLAWGGFPVICGYAAVAGRLERRSRALRRHSPCSSRSRSARSRTAFGSFADASSPCTASSSCRDGSRDDAGRGVAHRRRGARPAPARRSDASCSLRPSSRFGSDADASFRNSLGVPPVSLLNRAAK